VPAGLPDLLILDDFSLKLLRSPAPEDMYDIINERYEKGATLIGHDMFQSFGLCMHIFSRELKCTI